MCCADCEYFFDIKLRAGGSCPVCLKKDMPLWLSPYLKTGCEDFKLNGCDKNAIKS